jgi:hypothetical protein
MCSWLLADCNVLLLSLLSLPLHASFVTSHPPPVGAAGPAASSRTPAAQKTETALYSPAKATRWQPSATSCWQQTLHQTHLFSWEPSPALHLGIYQGTVMQRGKAPEVSLRRVTRVPRVPVMVPAGWVGRSAGGLLPTHLRQLGGAAPVLS